MRPLVALALATVAFVALVIAGLGMTSLLLDRDVVAVPGLGQVPGVVATTSATLAFAGVLWAVVRRPQPGYAGAAVAAVAAPLAYAAGLWAGAVLTGADLAAATAAAGGVLVSWPALVLAASGLACAWGGIALVRTRAQRPRWPWEDEADL